MQHYLIKAQATRLNAALLEHRVQYQIMEVQKASRPTVYGKF